MRSIMSAGLLAIAALAACTPSAPINPPPPVVIADGTTLDERLALRAEGAYRAARLTMEAGVDSGVITGTRATQLAAIDRAAYAATLAVREAYKAGNATLYSDAYERAEKVLGLFSRGVQ